MSTTASTTKWIVRDKVTRKRVGKPTYESKGEAVAALPALTESIGPMAQLEVTQLLSE